MLPQAGRSLLRTAPRMAPELVQPTQRLSSVMQNRALYSQLPKTVSQGQQQESGGESSTPWYYKVPLYTGGAAATVGMAYYKAKNTAQEERVAELEEKIAVLGNYRTNAFKEISSTDGLDVFLGYVKSMGNLNLENFLMLLNYLKMNKPEVLLAALGKDDYFLDWVDLFLQTTAFEKWLMENPRYFVEFLKTISYRFMDPHFQRSSFPEVTFKKILSISEVLIQDSRYKKAILDFFDAFEIFRFRDEKYFIELLRFIDRKKYPHIAKNLQIGPFNNKKLLFLRNMYQDEIKQLVTIKSLEQQREEKMIEHLHNPILLPSKHLAKYQELDPRFIEDIIKTKSIDQFISALDKAVDLNNQGYIAFFHGQNEKYALINDLGTQLLFQLAGQKKPADFYFLRLKSHDFKKINLDPQEATTQIIEEQQDFMKWFNSGKGEDYMALNLFPFGNIGNEARYTHYYVENKYSQDETNYDYLLKSIFDDLEIPNFSAKERQKIYNLLDLAVKTYQTGRLIVIGLPYNVVSERVFTYKDFGGSISIDQLIEKLGKQENLSFRELDEFHCVMPLTPASGLNPESGVKIYNFDSPVSKKAQQEFDKAKQDFIDGVINSLKESGDLERSQKIARDYLKLLHDVHVAEELRLSGVVKH